ncbi:uncharacterized protein LOC119549537 [Drosophila subpulchrella]|uniref:uncharacterized protein LOC119549537 n=1 Tax=Drosophila subpulchrella TaxID=1486046 RepID=UPI0018A18C9D|nr:uncharacterized protein LOC119549537 [Drosophila subpulchrella]
MVSLRFSFVSIVLGVLLINGIRAARKWDYEPISIDAATSDESLINFDIKMIRISRGEFGVSATVEWNYDTTEETMVEAVVYRSSSGDESDYKMLPFNLPKQTFYDYLNTYYKDVIMKNFGPCSNAPQFEDKFQPPWPKKTYVAEKCVIEGDGLPEILPPGFYKIIFNCTGASQPSWSFTAIAKLTNKMF